MHNEDIAKLRATLARLSAEEARYALDQVVTVLEASETWSADTVSEIALTIDLAALRHTRAKRASWLVSLSRGLVSLGWP
jgi:hypothetical protein